jgi:DNA topoisomerase III
LIFRYIYEAAECRKPFSRLWISSLTPEAIRKGFGPAAGADYDRWPMRRAAAAGQTGWWA